MTDALPSEPCRIGIIRGDLNHFNVIFILSGSPSRNAISGGAGGGGFYIHHSTYTRQAD